MAQVVSGLTHLQSLSDQIALAEGKISSASETLRKQYGVGVVLEAIQAQQDLDRARADYVRPVAEYDTAHYRLSRAIGVTPAQGNSR